MQIANRLGFALIAIAFSILAFVVFAPQSKGAEPPRAYTTEPPAKAACTYCSNCTCKPGDCPAKCPLTYADAVARVAKGEVVYLSIGKRVETVSVCDGRQCQLVKVTAHTDSLEGFSPGVYECFLLNGKPVMQRRK